MRKKIGSLECLVRPGEEGKNVVFLHGFGADNADLYPLADYLDADGEWNFIFPNAPLEVPIGPHNMGRGWFPISLRELESGVDFTQIRPPGLDASAKAVEDLVFHLNSKTLVLGGFSQGAMIAAEVALADPNSVSGLVIYSGVMLDQPGWTKKASGLKGKPVLQSHGQHDPVLPIAAAQKLHELLKSAGADITFMPFGGQHEIPQSVLRKTQEFLKQF